MLYEFADIVDGVASEFEYYSEGNIASSFSNVKGQ